MLLTRFWYLLLAATAAIAVAGVMLARATFNREYDAHLEDALRRDRLELEQTLKIDARVRLDAIAPIAANADVRAALRDGAPGRTLDAAKRAAIGRTLEGLNRQLGQMAADLLFAVNSEGTIVAQLGGSAPPAGAGLGAFPVVERALTGYLRDDVWIYEGRVYRIAVRPVIDRSEYVGAVVHGRAIDDGLAAKLGERLHDASVVFHAGDDLVASYVPSVASAPRREDLAGPIASLATNAAYLAEGKSDSLEVADQRGRALCSLITGTSRAARVGYCVARPRVVLASPLDIFQQASREDVAEVGIAPLVAFGLVAFGLGMLFVWLERDRPLGHFRQAMELVADGRRERLEVAAHGGGFRRVAELSNRAFDALVGKASELARKKPADLDAILGPAPASSATTPFFGFSKKGASSDEVLSIPPVPAGPRPPMAPPQAPSATLDAGDRTPIPAVPPTDPGDFEEGNEEATAITRVPEELLAATIQNSLQDGERKHFREVFDHYLDVRKQCGEGVDGLTFEKFSATLRKNREQIVSKHGAREVKFSVYVKDGKAAIKATPVKQA